MNLINMPRAAWKRQPQGAVKLVQSELTQDIVECFVFNNPRSLVTGNVGTLAGDATIKAGANGVGVDSPSHVSNSNYFAFPKPINLDAQNITVEWFGVIRGFKTTSRWVTSVVSFFTTNGGFSSHLNIGEYNSAGSNKFPSFEIRTTAWPKITIQEPITLDAPAYIAGTYNGSQLSVFYNKRFNTSNVTGSMAFPNANVWVGCDADSIDARSINGQSNFVIIRNKALPSAAVLEISKNPWQLFAPTRSLAYFIPSAPVLTIPALSAPGVTDIGSTSVRPQVTLTYT